MSESNFLPASAFEDDMNEAARAKAPIDPDGVRFSRLKWMAESPAHYLENPQGDSSTLDKGTAVHSILLGGKKVVYYDGRTKNDPNKIGPRNGAQWEAFKAAHAEDTILSLAEYNTSNRIADAVRANRLAMEVLGDGVYEDTIRFTYLGLPCRTTPDMRSKDGSRFAELKTCRSSNPWRFKFQARSMKYHAQMALHREGGRRAKLWPDKDKQPVPYVVAVQSTPPFAVTVFRVAEETMALGDKMIRLWFERLKGCIESRSFPPYSQTVVELAIEEAELDIGEGTTYTAGELPEGW